MSHIDEGTIHAWLDGALSAERAREVDAHVAQCPSCSSAVAEARGLIAGASRILTALDDVPANVTPKRAAPSAPPKRQRQWRAAPWVTGIAAALILAVGLTTWNRDRGLIMRSEVAAPAMETDSVRPLIGASQSLADTQVPVSAGRDAKRASANAPPGVMVPQMSKKSASPQQPLDAARRQRAASTTRQLEVAPAPPTATAAEGRVSGAAVRIDTATERREPRDFAAASADTSRLRRKSPTQMVMPGTSDTIRRRRLGEGVSLRLEEVVVTSVGANVVRDSIDARQAAGCYELGRVMDDRSGVAKQNERVAAAAAPPSDAQRSVAREQRGRADVAAPRTPSRVRLDTTQSTAGLMVRDGSTDAHIGSWQRIAGGDSVRVMLPGRGPFVLATKDRVSCPEQ